MLDGWEVDTDDFLKECIDVIDPAGVKGRSEGLQTLDPTRE